MRKTILFVDDEPDVRRTMRYWLASLGYRAIDAVDGEHAWKLVQEHTPDLVMTDVAMPQMDGVELCRRIKLTEATAGIPVIMFTSHDQTDLQLAGTEAGADAYVSKETDFRILQARLEAILKDRTRQSEATQRQVETAKRQTLSQTVTTLAHHINNSVMAIHATASAIDPASPDHARTLRRVCQTEARKMLTVLRALKKMAEEEELKTTVYVGSELMFDLERELTRLASPATGTAATKPHNGSQ